MLPSDVPADLVKIGAEGIAPHAFEPFDLARVRTQKGCASLWHWEGHSSHSRCPTCGEQWTTSEERERSRRKQAVERSEYVARKVLANVLPDLEKRARAEARSA
jgi:hypothetical protein